MRIHVFSGVPPAKVHDPIHLARYSVTEIGTISDKLKAKNAPTTIAVDLMTDSNIPKISYDLAMMDIPAICRAIGAEYWGQTQTPEQLERAFDHSACVGLSVNTQQVGFARAISDQVTSAYIKDFVVFPNFRSQGFGRLLLDGLFAHPDLRAVPSWYLGTKDAQPFYTAHGFKKAPDGIYMFLHRDRAKQHEV